jgi:long-chain acyl-CoA synthetase
LEKIWLKSYQKGVPAEIELNEFQSLGELFEKSVAQYRDRVAYINMGAEITYGELDKCHGISPPICNRSSSCPRAPAWR